jgi:hypothetical protein
MDIWLLSVDFDFDFGIMISILVLILVLMISTRARARAWPKNKRADPGQPRLASFTPLAAFIQRCF